MAGNKWPWFKFFPSDWLSDPELQSCSPAARGVWIDLICLSYACKRPGYLVNPDGKPWSKAKIVASIRGDPAIVNAAIAELLENGVLRFDDETGAHYSNRVVKDTADRASNSERMRSKRVQAHPTPTPNRPPHIERTIVAQTPIVQKISASVSVSGSDSCLSDGGSGGKPTARTWDGSIPGTYRAEVAKAWNDHRPERVRPGSEGNLHGLNDAIWDVQRLGPPEGRHDPLEWLLGQMRAYLSSREAAKYPTSLRNFIDKRKFLETAEQWNHAAAENTTDSNAADVEARAREIMSNNGVAH